MAKQIQLALQGGGAKIAVLMAAAEAVQELEKLGEIEITRIAGTSAGAIVGAFLAAGHDSHREPNCDIAEIRRSLVNGQGETLLGNFPIPWMSMWNLRLLLRLFSGKTFWNDAPLRQWLQDQFTPGPGTGGTPARRILGRDDQPIQRISQLHKPLLIVSTNLENAGGEKHTGDVDLVTSLLHSAGLPFCLRTWEQTSILVDGGLTENLPVDHLLEQELNFGRVVAFSFEDRRPKRPADLLSFSQSLLDAAITHSVGSARARVGAESVCTLDPQGVSTFDFGLALKFLSDANGDYSATKKRVLEWFRDLIYQETARKTFANVTKDVWRNQKNEDLAEQMRGIGSIYAEQHARQKFTYLGLRLDVVANGLAPSGHPGFGKPDEVTYELLFAPGDSPIFAHRITLSSPGTSDFFGLYKTEFFGKNKTSSCIKVLASTRPDSPHDRELIVYFLPALAPGSGEYRLSLQDLGKGVLDKLKDENEDSIKLLFSRAAGPVGFVEIVVRIPRSFLPLKKKHCNVPCADVSDERLLEISRGTPIDYSYRIQAWRSENVTGVDEFEISFSKA